MRAIRVHHFGGPEVMLLEDVPTPVPDRGQVLVQVTAAGINPVDTYIRAGTYSNTPAAPYTPGLEGAGTVIACGPGVTRFSPGDRVVTCARTLTGTYAEQCLCEEAHLMPLPQSLSMDEGAALYIAYATAYRALFQLGRWRPGDRVFVHGASGGVGLAALQWARSQGMRTVGSAGSDGGALLVEAQGADLTVRHDTPGYLDEAMAFTSGEGFDTILEMAAHHNLDKDLDVVADGGRVMVIGSRAPLTLNPRKTMARECIIRGVMLFKMDQEGQGEFEAAVEAGADLGWLRPHIGRRFDLSQAAEAHTAVLASGARGKLILETAPAQKSEG